jgi:hypothetical protein
VLGSQKVERHIRFVTDNPTVMAGRAWGNIEEGASWTYVLGPAVDGSSGATGQDQTHVLDVATRRPYSWADIRRPAPSRFVCGPSDRQSCEANDLELSFVKDANLVGLIKAFQNDVQHDSSGSSEGDRVTRGFPQSCRILPRAKVAPAAVEGKIRQDGVQPAA